MAKQRGALALGLGWFAGQVAVLGVREDLSSVSRVYLLALVIAPLAASGICLVLALAPGRLGLGARVSVLVPMAIVVPTTLFVAGLALSPAHADGSTGSLIHSLQCFAIMAGWAALPLASAGLVLRRWFVARATVRSALLGLSAGMAAAAVINLHCPITDVWHVALGHWVAVVLAATLGAWLLAKRTRI